MSSKKLYLVKREVLATSLAKALISKGHVYEIMLAEDKFQPENKKESLGFKKKK